MTPLACPSAWRRCCSLLTNLLDFFIVMLYLDGREPGICAVAVSLAEVTIRLSNEMGTLLALSPALLGLASGPLARIWRTHPICVSGGGPYGRLPGAGERWQLSP